MNKLEKYNYLMPTSGMANTVAGELVRAVNKILYRFYNDGDVFCYGYGKETCGCAATYLKKNVHDDGKICNHLMMMDSEYGYYDICQKPYYKKHILELVDMVVDYIDNNQNLLTETNHTDMYDEDGSWWGYSDEDC